MEKFKKDVLILNVKHLSTSYYGNPTLLITAFDGESVETYKTATNASAGYALSGSSSGVRYSIVYHITKSGKKIIETVERLQNFDNVLYSRSTAAIKAGYRELFAMLNGKPTQQKNLITFKYSSDIEYQSGNGATFDSVKYEWIN